MLFREIAHSSLGTQLDCKGNHFMKADNFIVDSSKPKYCLALTKPTCTTENIGILFDNTRQELQNIYQRLTMDERPNICMQFTHTDWMKSSSSINRAPRDLILVYFGPIYGIPPTIPSTSSSHTIGTKQKLVGEDNDSTDDHEVKNQSNTSTSSTIDTNDIVYPSEKDIYVGAHYNPRLLPDYGGNLFRHHEAKLVQHDVRDIDLRLIPPWEYYDKLRASTMILCDITLHMYQMAIPNASSSQPKTRKTFKINAETIRVITKSDLPIEICHQPLLPTTAPLTMSTTNATCPQADSTLTPCTQFKVFHEETDNDAANDELLMKIEWSDSESSQPSNIATGKMRTM
ncbi:hypothetical protein L208DRAFT_1266596 [Tricholoma matsutake]|nr:hypothetical protein L208DRAFT_1266596 [Tricholoma matsutake 945]